MTALVPELSVTDWRESLRFYRDILGFSLRYARPDEGFAYLALGEAELMIDEIGKGRTFDTSLSAMDRPFGRGTNLQIQAKDIAKLLSALEAAEWPLFLPLEDRWYEQGTTATGNRQFVVADPDGYLLRFYEDLGERQVIAALPSEVPRP